MELTKLLIYALAAWRISSIFVNEGGPFDVFLKIRTRIAGIRYDEFRENEISVIPGNILAGILSCVWCCSVWVGFFFSLFWLIFPTISLIFAVPFALSALAIGYNKLLGGE